MSDKNQHPDRAGSYDADGLDVPTYSQDANAANPNPPAQGTGSTPLSAGEAGGVSGTDATTQFPQAPAPSAPSGNSGTGLFGRSRRAEPQEIPAYTDQDFATPGGAANETFAYDRPPEQSTTVAPAAVPAAGATAASATPVAVAPDQSAPEGDPAAPDHRRGTIDFGLLIIRLMLGLWLVLEAVGTFFRLGGNPGLAGLESDYAGYLAPGGLAIVIPSLQLAAGVFLLLGLITPVFAMLATVATSFTALHELTTSGAGLDVFAWPESVWLSLVLLGSSLALQFTGPGFISLDYGRSWARRPLLSSWLFVVLAIAGGVALWWFGAGINPLA